MKSNNRIDFTRFYIGETKINKQSIQHGLTTLSCSRDARVYRWTDKYSHISSTILGKRVSVFKNQKTSTVPNIMSLTYAMSPSSSDEQISELITQISP